MTIDDHQLNDMIPVKRLIIYNLREQSQYPLPLCKTNRYKNTHFIGDFSTANSDTVILFYYAKL